MKKAEKCQIQKAIMLNKENINECKNFTIKLKKTVKIKLPIETASWKHRKATTCTVCEENCHELDCWWTSNPSKCEVMKEATAPCAQGSVITANTSKKTRNMSSETRRNAETEEANKDALR